MAGGLPTWREAWTGALYGPDGFYRREAPAAHFRTSVHASEHFAGALVRLARAAGLRRVVDIGAGRGELLAQVARLEPTWDLLAVELAPRPDGLPGAVRWAADPPRVLHAALVVANEWLDVVPCEVVRAGPDGTVRVLHVDPSTGRERPGAPVGGADAGWLHRWWPPTGEGARAEVGRPRDEAWASLVSAAAGSLLVAVDYAHAAGDRPPQGSLAGYRAGRAVPPVPDGSCDLTAHVALDACAAAGLIAGADASLLTTQRAALRALGVDGRPPPYDLGRTDPRAYLSALVGAGEAAELLRPGGLGGFGWLVQGVGLGLPGAFRGLG